MAKKKGKAIKIQKPSLKKLFSKIPRPHFLDGVDFMSADELLKNTLFTIILWTGIASLIYGLDKFIQLILKQVK